MKKLINWSGRTLFFQREGKPVPSFYRWDGVLLAESGLKRIKQCLQQALNDGNLMKGGVWKRRPAGRALEGIRTRKIRGNLVVF